MTLHPQVCYLIPDDTARLAHAIFPDPSPVMRIRDELGMLFDDQQFAALFPQRGQSAFSPARLLLVTILQFMEGLTDRQAADAVRRCIDWKYALALELTDRGFDFSILSEFRDRLLAAAIGPQLLDRLLALCRERGWVKARGRQPTDATHVLAAIRTLNRLECVGETLSHALHSLLLLAPEWTRAHMPADWFDRYALRFEEYHLPQEATKRQALALVIGGDGYQLLAWLDQPTTPELLHQIPALQVLRQVWTQQYEMIGERITWRSDADLPAAGQRVVSPYDPDARRGKKRETIWTGYKVHLTESCDEQLPHLITDVRTTPATSVDGACLPPIHTALAARQLLPSEHLVDSGYIDADALVDSRADHQIALVGPAPADTSWQARTAGAYTMAYFEIDWQAQQVRCPEGNTSRKWNPGHDEHGNPIITVWFDEHRCMPCPVRARCTRASTRPRTMQLRPRPQFEALHSRRAEQTSDEFKQRYAKRAGIEGTLAQGVQAFDLRWARYRGLAKTSLQHIFTSRRMRWEKPSPTAFMIWHIIVATCMWAHQPIRHSLPSR